MSALAVRFGRQLANPRGLGGPFVGTLMAVANRRATALAIAALGIEPGDAVVDLGCGFGDALPDLIRLATGGRVYGVDHSGVITSTAERHPRVTCHQASFTSLPFANDSVDRMLATNVAYFWHDDRAVLAEIGRVLRPGGRLALYVTDADALRRVGLGKSGTHRLFTGRALRDMLGGNADIRPVDAGWGVRGWIATVEREFEPEGSERTNSGMGRASWAVGGFGSPSPTPRRI